MRAKEDTLMQYNRTSEATQLKMQIDQMTENLSDDDDSSVTSSQSDDVMTLMDERSFNMELGKVDTSQ